MSDADLDDHQPGPIDGDGHVRCDCCGFRYPCPTLRSQPRSLEDGERAVLDALDIGIGYHVERRDPEGGGNPVGGTVVGVFDDEDGRRVLRLIDFPGGRHRWRTLRLDQVDPAGVHLPRADILRSQGRRLAAEVGREKGVATGEEIELLSDAITLIRGIA